MTQEPLLGQEWLKSLKPLSEEQKQKNREERIALLKERRKKASGHIRQCAFCGTDKELEEHHMIPLSMGGTNDELNLVFLCKDCHKAVTSYQWKIWKEGVCNG